MEEQKSNFFVFLSVLGGIFPACIPASLPKTPLS